MASATSVDSQVEFCTLAMFIIDDIYPAPSAADQTPHLNVAGGAGTYSAIGARILSPPPRSQDVGWILDAGTDFPPELLRLIQSWDTGVVLRQRNGLTTRAWNGYGENEHRDFKYLTSKQRLTSDDLTPRLLRSKSFHLVCSAQRCGDLISQILLRRKEVFPNEDLSRPLFVWEPVPDLCLPGELGETLATCKLVDVVSPNHEELASLLKDVQGSGDPHAHGVSKKVVEAHAAILLDSAMGPERQVAVVVRCGKEGCYYLTATGSGWLPAFHTDQTKLVDPTGGGNGFLGGLAVGLVRTEFDVKEACVMGSVAASFCIEQVGLPVVRSGIGVEELWNGTSVEKRLMEMRRRVE